MVRNSLKKFVNMFNNKDFNIFIRLVVSIFFFLYYWKLSKTLRIPCVLINYKFVIILFFILIYFYFLYFIYYCFFKDEFIKSKFSFWFKNNFLT